MGALANVLQSFLTFVQQSSVGSTPAAGRNLLYFKTDGKLYKKDSAGSESEISTLTEGAWTDYSATSTIVGWSSFVTKYISYSRVGKRVSVAFLITGTSNSTTTTFTIPSASIFTAFTFAEVKAGASYQAGMAQVVGSTVTIYKDAAFNSFSGSGDKEVYGEFWYQEA